MAETEEIKEQKEQAGAPTEKKTAISRFLPWILLTLIVLFCVVAGLGLGRLFASSRTLEIAKLGTEPNEVPTELDIGELSAKDAGKVWYYDLEPVVANLNEPGVTRYVRATFTLEMSPEIDEKKQLVGRTVAVVVHDLADENGAFRAQDPGVVL